MTRALAIRELSLYLPLVACIAAWKWRNPGRLEATGALLATAWNIPALFAVNLLAVRFGWWRFGVAGATINSIPVDLWLGWTALWGVFAALGFRSKSILPAMVAFGSLDLVLMPHCPPVVVLGQHWIYGEILGLLTCLCPALLLARWTRKQVKTSFRALLQFLCFSGLFLLCLFAVLAHSGESIAITQFRSIQMELLLEIAFLICLPGLSAVQEFAAQGNGTPLPFDPPGKLVSSGIYSYLANPMQTSYTLLLLLTALAFWNSWLLFAALLSFFYSAGLAWWDEDEDLKRRFGEEYTIYRRNVRDWLPRWRPYVAKPAHIYLSSDCIKCSQMARFLQGLGPVRLEIKAAEEHPQRDLMRMTYESADGTIEAAGILALARAFEHVNFAWAMLGMAMRLPVVHLVLQAFADISGGAPMLVKRRTNAAVCVISRESQ